MIIILNYKERDKNMNKQLTKGHDIQLAGVCSGIAEYFNIDVNIIRIAAILLGMFFFPAIIILYIVFAIVLPNNDGSPSLYKTVNKDEETLDIEYDNAMNTEYENIDTKIENSFEKTNHKKSKNPFEM